MRIVLSLTLTGILLAAGCSHQRDGFSTQGFTQLSAPVGPRPELPTTAPNVVLSTDASLSGKVVKVNTGGRFVVLNFPIGHLPMLDQQMSVYRSGLKVGEVRVSGPQLEDNIVGDLMKGNAQVGDEVKEQ